MSGVRLVDMVLKMEQDGLPKIQSKYDIAKRALIQLSDAYKENGNAEESELVTELISDLMDLYVNVDKYKQRKGM